MMNQRSGRLGSQINCIKNLLSLPCLLLFFGLNGCVHTTKDVYEGPPRPPEEIAQVYCDFFQRRVFGWVPTDDVCFISHVDGVSLYEPPLKALELPSHDFVQMNLIPGDHSIKLQYDNRRAATLWEPLRPLFTLMSRKSTILKFRAEAGHTYKIYFDKKDGELSSWIKDDDTEEIVTGTPQN